MHPNILEVGGHMVVVVLIVKVVDRVGLVGKKKIEASAGKRRKCAGACIATGRAVPVIIVLSEILYWAFILPALRV
jgi:hypothetical protein